MNAARASAVLFATTLNIPLAGRVAERLTGEPHISTEMLGDVPCLVARPADPRPSPALVFGNGAHRLGAEEPFAERGIKGLARAGFLVVAPDLPGLRLGEITPATLEALVAVTLATSARPDARGGRVTLLGACTGAGLSLLAAEDPRVADRIAAVFGIAPFADLRNVLRLATTGWYEAEAGRLLRYPVAPLLACAAGRSLALALEPSPSRQVLLGALPSEPDGRPLLESLVEGSPVLQPDAAAAASLLRNRDPARFEMLFDALPAAVREKVAQLSPLCGANRLRARVELASGPHDPYFPLSESRALTRASSRVRLTVTSTLDHARPRASAGDLADLARFAGLVGRFARHA